MLMWEYIVSLIIPFIIYNYFELDNPSFPAITDENLSTTILKQNLREVVLSLLVITLFQSMSNEIELLSPPKLQQSVVVVEGACKTYGSRKNSVFVLRNLNMVVPHGVIYGLLGSSGCGKTTLLNCILGQKKLDDGNVWVLGGAPNSKKSRVPGPSVGYMPQSVGIQPEFTTRETMTYFGEIVGLPKKKIEERIQFLRRLLMLADLDLGLGNLSGGEKRRVSFAVALIHEPELLILDEPTVGLDPLLRENIWNYLYEITTERQITVIMTTHYIDEARNANIVSLLRGGTLLAEESPDSLISRLEVCNLEEAFSKLSTLQSNNDNKLPPVNCKDFTDNNYSFPKTTTRGCQIRNLKPLFYKNCKWILRNYPILAFIIAIPALQIFLFNAAVGHDPINLNLAIVNQETTVKNCTPITCNSGELSCNFLQYLENLEMNLIYYDDEESAIESVQRGKSYASIFLKQNYSQGLKKRLQLKILEDRDLMNSNIDVYRDLSNYNIGMFLTAKLIRSFDSFVTDYLNSCNKFNGLSSPLKFQEPIYGKHNPDFTEFTIPAVVLSSILFFSAWSTASALLTEFANGVTERTIVLGVNPLYLLLAHVMCEFLILIIHLVTVYVSLFLILKFPLKGSLVVFLSIIFLQGCCGLSFGIFLYSTCSTDSLATYILLGSFFPASILSGIMWPLEAMPKALQIIAFYLPFTTASDAMRSVIQRGWGFTVYSIYISFVIVTVWTLVLLLIGICRVKYNKK